MSTTWAKRSRLQTFAGRIGRRFLRNRLAVLSLVVLLTLAVIVLLAPVLAPYAYDEQDIELLGQPSPPSMAHLLGTDQLGRDSLSRVLYGGRISLAVDIAAALVSTAIGALSGFHRSWTDVAIMRATDVVLSVPALPLILLIWGLLRPTVPLLIDIIASLSWMGTARLVRGQFLTLREREYVEAARALGATSSRLIIRHLLPNAVAPITVSATLVVGQAI